METQATRTRHNLEAGQLWKLEDGYLYIVELGRRLIHYKLLRQPGQRAAITRLIGLEPLLTYLRLTEAELVIMPATMEAARGFTVPVVRA
jgi:hypothetical protein